MKTPKILILALFLFACDKDPVLTEIEKDLGPFSYTVEYKNLMPVVFDSEEREVIAFDSVTISWRYYSSQQLIFENIVYYKEHCGTDFLYHVESGTDFYIQAIDSVIFEYRQTALSDLGTDTYIKQTREYSVNEHEYIQSTTTRDCFPY